MFDSSTKDEAKAGRFQEEKSGQKAAQEEIIEGSYRQVAPIFGGEKIKNHSVLVTDFFFQTLYYTERSKS